MVSERSTPAGAASSRPRRGRAGWLLAAPLLFFILIPILAVFLRLSPQDMLNSLQDSQVLAAIRLSAVTTLATVLISVLAGTPVAYLLYHRRSRFSHLIDTIIDLPTILPPSVAGVALLIAFGRQGLLGAPLTALGISLPFTVAAVILAQTFIAAPLYVKSAALGFAAVNKELKKAAALDGASQWQIFRYVMLPLSWPAILNGCILTWARALGEFGATIIFAGNFPGRTQTMPLAIYIGFEIELTTALTLSAILLSVSFLVLAATKTLLHRSIADMMLE